MEIVPWVIAAFVAGGSFAFFIRIMEEQKREMRATISAQAEHIEILQGDIVALQSRLNFELGVSQADYVKTQEKKRLDELKHPAPEHERDDVEQADWVGDDE
jgi:hypothetical protein